MKIGAEERGFHRFQPKDIPSERWMDDHLRGKPIRVQDPRIAYLLEEQAGTILTWAVGNDWWALPAPQWPRRIAQKIGLEVSQDIRIALSQIREAWDHYQRTGRLPG